VRSHKRGAILGFGSLLILVAVVHMTSMALAGGRANEPPAIVAVTMPDGMQDEEYSFTFTATDPDNVPAELSWSDDTPLFDVNGSGGIIFTPLNADVGYHTFNITVSDPGVLTDTRAFTLFIANVNDPPVLHYIPPQTALEDQVFTLDLAGYVDDPDLLLPQQLRDHITYRDDTPKLDTNLETGVVTWDVPTNEDVGDFFFKVTIQDSKGRYAEQEIEINVINTNNPPRISTIPRQVLHQDSPYVFNIPFSDPDLSIPSAGEELTFSNDHHDLFTIDGATGRIQFTPVNNQVGVWEVNITVTDAAGASTIKKVIFEVVNKNDAPELEYINIQQLTEDVPYMLQLEAADPDMEPRLVDGLPVDPNERLEYRTNSTRVPIERATGLISFTPTNDDAMVGDIYVKITVIDRASETAVEDVLFKVTNVNDPPTDVRILGLVEGQILLTGTAYNLAPSVIDVDNALTELTYTWYTGTDLMGQGIAIEWEPNEPGPLVIRLVVSDPDGGQAEGTVSVLVMLSNTAPFDIRIEGLVDDQSVRTDTNYSVSCFAKDDHDALDDLVYEWYLNGTLLSRTRSLVWRPEGEGPRTLTLEVTDADGAKGSAAITVDVAKIPPLPIVIYPQPGTTVNKGDDLVVTLDVPAAKLDPGKDYTINVSSNVSGPLLTKNLDDGLELDVGKLPVGDHQITVTISDGTNEANTRFNITVVEPPKKVASPGPGTVIVIAGLLVVAVRARRGRPEKRG